MRYIDLTTIIERLPEEVKTSLSEKELSIIGASDSKKESTIVNGNSTWRQVKPTFEDATGRKCWFSESKNPGFPNDVEHFRPKGKKVDKEGNFIFWYWFLAFDPENYRISSGFPNRPNHNPLFNVTGGKHTSFPLMKGDTHASEKSEVEREHPMLLDPCNETDCQMLEFQPDGLPIVASGYKDDLVAQERVDTSKILLNLAYPTFIEDRGQLYNDVKNLIDRGERYANEENSALEDVKEDLGRLMHKDSPYSSAAECYIRMFRHHEWVEEILD